MSLGMRLGPFLKSRNGGTKYLQKQLLLECARKFSNIGRRWRKQGSSNTSVMKSLLILRAAVSPVPMLAAMRAVLVDHYAANLSAVEVSMVPMPKPAAGELLVRIDASSVNPIDYKILDGALNSSFPLTFPQILGDDMLGTVIGCGAGVCEKGSRFRPGVRVWADLGVGGAGAWAEAVAVKASVVGVAPRPTAHRDAAALATLPLVGMTMLQALDTGADALTPARRAANQSVVVVTSGSGGTGTVGVQLAKALGASHVVSTAGNASVAAFVRTLGADVVFNYHTQPLLDQLPDDSVDVFVDNYGYDADAALAKVRSGGTLVSLTHTLPSSSKPGVRALAITCNASRRADLDTLARYVESGRLRPVVDRTFRGLDQAPDALRAMMAGHVVGKLALAL